MTKPRFNRILLTGAAGRLGTHLRRGLAPLCTHLRVADMAEIKGIQPNEEALQFDLADMEATLRATEGVDAIVHFGGVPLERSWDSILNGNIRGSYHIYEGARGSLRVGLMGDRLAGIAARNGWVGVVINGAIRDSAGIDSLDIGVKALGTTARRGAAPAQATRDEPVSFGAVTFSPDDWVYADRDCVIAAGIRLVEPR